ncbi:MAG TPA: hypothetical protein VKX46_00545 [Ktedonobacteraceae bacterium]|nr:hypothetical protein [Ktedonobacteraceae bacterium]
MERPSLANQMKQETNTPMTREMKQTGNATMAQRVLQMPVVPYEDGKFVYRVVEIRGRKSGTMRQVPLAVFQYEGIRYLIAPERSRDWVQNLQVTGECLLITSKQQEHYHAALTFDPTALAAVRAYIGQLAWASQQFPFSPNDNDEYIRSKTEQFAIFRLSC